MTDLICKILATRLAPLKTGGIISQISGLVKPFSTILYAESSDENNITEDILPIPFDMSEQEACCEDKCLALVPDGQKKGIIFFEETDLPRIIGKEPKNAFNYSQNIRLVCWYNGNFFEGTDVSSEILGAIIKTLYNGSFTPGYIRNLDIKGHTFNIANKDNIFRNYNFNAERFHALDYPYGFFSIELALVYSVDYDCIPLPTIKDEQDCC